ncbi:MAG TPA: endolytic transglycosylase MltG [Gemmatimonadales bacterium]
MRSSSRTERRGRRARLPRPLALLTAGLLLLSAACGGGEPGEAVRVVVPRGASLGVVADSLERTGVIGSARMFRLYAKLTDRDRSIKAGTYELRQGISWSELLDALTEGRGVVVTVTIPEGMALPAVESLLVARLEVPSDSVAAVVRDSTLRARLGIPTPTLEGYLFPATYTFVPGTSARAAVEEMVDQFERRWRPGWTARLDSLDMTRHQLVTLASIVEKEARVAEERPVIAAVYHNRLDAGMPLQADPTVQYALGAHVDRVLYKHLETDSPYNTYRNAGLPPGPIASPGTASIVATLYPVPVSYMYFVARPDGRHEFRDTFAEHTRARAEVQRMRAARPPAAAPAPDSRD